MTHQVGSSTVSLTEEELTITIPRAFWSKKQWVWLTQLLLQVILSGANWIIAPSTPSPSSGEGRKARWKLICIDALSGLLFALLIRSSHPLRKLFSAIDWDQIDERCAKVYKNAERGAPAYAPQVLFRILLLMFSSGTPFESATLQRLETDVAWRWFVGLNLWMSVPDAGTLSRFRKRLGVELFEAILIDLILVCDAAGLIGHEESYYDMTGVEASATQVTPYQRAVILAKAMTTWLDQNQGGLGMMDREQVARIALEVLREVHPSLNKVSPAQIVSSQERLAKQWGEDEPKSPGWWQRIVQTLCELTPQGVGTALESLRQVASELVFRLPQAFGNPDATVGHTRTNGTLCGYRSGFLVDAKRLIITAVVVVRLSQSEAPTVVTALEQHYAVFGKYPKQLGLDSAFDRDEVHRYTEPREIFTSITIRARPGVAGVYHAEAFVWNEEGQLLCPHGQEMVQVGGLYKDGTQRYQATGECAKCPHKQGCLTDKQAQKDNPRRELRTNPGAHQRAQRHRERSRTPEGKDIRRRRFASESVFGHTNHYHNGDKAPYRDGAMDTIAQIMVAYVSNLEKLAKPI